MTLSDLYARFQGQAIIQRQITRKRYKIELLLQWRTNRKSYNVLSNRAIFNDLKRPQAQISRSGDSLTPNISEMAKDGHSYYRRRIGNRT